ncbi:probable splicing factor YJU2B [Zophobas morio]|uniref:probable splicing factor YJU2B n=1 Tax=Zophobas morio TaxID=2755281 RepID=UPI0030839974
MAERKAVNKYMPPDYDPQKHGSINKYRGQHPLRERARKLDQGILIIRFELPYKIWCLGCKKTFAMGVRYNAEKKKIGNYFSTPIYSFRMKCHECPNWFEIHTDPKNTQYVCGEGCRKKIEEWDTEKVKNITLQVKVLLKSFLYIFIKSIEDNESYKLASNALYKLEHDVQEKEVAKKSQPSLLRIKEIKDSRRDDYALNRLLRDSFREEKKRKLLEKIGQSQLQKEKNVNYTILPENEEDEALAKLVMLRKKLFSGDITNGNHALKLEPIKSSVINERVQPTWTTNKLKLLMNMKRKTKVTKTKDISSLVIKKGKPQKNYANSEFL